MPNIRARLFGGLELEDANGEPLTVNGRKTRALLGFLVVEADRWHQRDRLTGLLWADRAETQARNSLNQALYEIRKLETAAGVTLIERETDRVRLVGAEIETDLSEFQASLVTEKSQADTMRVDDLLRGLEAVSSEFGEWLAAKRDQLRTAQQVALKDRIAEAIDDGDATAGVVAARGLIELDPLDEEARRSLMILLARMGNRAAAIREYQVCAKVLQEELGIEPDRATTMVLEDIQASARPATASESLGIRHLQTSPTTKSPRDLSEPPTPANAARQDRSVSDMAAKQRVRFCTSADGTRIAYAKVGVGAPILKAPNFLNHLEYEWGNPIWNSFLAEFARQNTLLRFDQRGTGLSDRDVRRTSIESMIEDMEAVVRATNLDKFALFGISQGAAFSVQYAAKHPDQVSCIIILGGFARGRLMRQDPEQEKRYEIVRIMIREGWGSPSPIYRNFFTANFLPDAPLDVQNSFDELQRVSCSSENALRIAEMNNLIDVVEAAKSIQVPTLILHNKGDRMAALSEGQEFARLIPGATFVELPGENHLVFKGDPSFDQFFDEVRAFLSEHAIG